LKRGRRPLAMVNLEDIAERLDMIEVQLRDLTLTSARSHTSLIGWSAISAYVGKSPDTLRRYRTRTAFPAIRFGSRVMSTTDLISAWLLEYDARRRRRGKGYTGGMIANKKEQPNVSEVRGPEHSPTDTGKERDGDHIP